MNAAFSRRKLIKAGEGAAALPFPRHGAQRGHTGPSMKAQIHPRSALKSVEAPCATGASNQAERRGAPMASVTASAMALVMASVMGLPAATGVAWAAGTASEVP